MSKKCLKNKDMSIEMIKRKTGLWTVYLKIQNSLDNIKEKHGNRKDLIDSMEKSLTEVGEAVLYFEHVDKLLQASNKKQFAMEIEIMQLKQKIRHLEQINVNIEI
jgi:hypothetical protein